jgi:hypothetical protein
LPSLQKDCWYKENKKVIHREWSAIRIHTIWHNMMRTTIPVIRTTQHRWYIPQYNVPTTIPVICNKRPVIRTTIPVIQKKVKKVPCTKYLSHMVDLPSFQKECQYTENELVIHNKVQCYIKKHCWYIERAH